MTTRSSSILLGALCAAASTSWAQASCQSAATAGGPSWQEIRQSLEQRVLEAPSDGQKRLALAQYLTYCDATRREGILQLLQLAKDRSVSAAALESWRQALGWVESDATSVPLYEAYLRLRPKDRQVRAQLTQLESGGLLPGNRAGTAPVALVAPTYAQAPQQAVDLSLARAVAIPSLPPQAATVAAATTAVAPAVSAPAGTSGLSGAASGWSALPARVGTSQRAATALSTEPGAAQDPVQAQISDLRADIREIEQSRAPEFSVGTLVRSRGGEGGLSRLTDTEVPMELKFGLGAGKLSLRITPTLLNAGAPATTYDVLSRFGAGPTSALADSTAPVSAGSQNDFGLGVGVAYEARNWQADIGTTPLGFNKVDISAGIRFKQPISDRYSLDLSLSRRPVRDSVLSFAGARDDRSGVVWGGVSASGARAGLTWDNGRTGIYGFGALHYLAGSYVESNTRLEAGAGVYQHFVRDADRRFTAGVAMTALTYDKNLRYFTFGHGGYFSPQEFVSVSLPVEWQERYGRLRYHLKASLGVQYIREEASPFFPSSAARQSAAAQAAADAESMGLTGTNSLAMYGGQRKTGLGYGFSGAVEYQLQPQLWLGGSLGFDNARDYRQFTGGIYLRYAFQPAERPLGLPLNTLRSPYDYD
jgi:hypothetical protein